ncbi:heavy metal-binding domain-containing protein [Candidatus Enterococcus mansonii]|nr:heavy metal-binding domain-containing protein [Enterococcus sp. 4G2_DIV0659]
MRRAKKEQLTEQELENRLSSITLSTGNVNKKYILRDIVFATDRIETDLFSSEVNPNEVFSGVYRQLKEIAFEYEADAVINCHFEEKYVEYQGQWVVEIFAYGTVVQFTQTNIG